MTDLENEIFQAHCAVENLQDFFEEGGRIRHVLDDLVTIDLEDESETTVNLEPIQRLLNTLRKMSE